MFTYINNKIAVQKVKSLEQWMESSFDVIFVCICIFSIPIIVRSLFQAVHDGLYLNLFLYVACYLFGLFITFAKFVPFVFRAWGGVGILFIAGAIAIFTVGPLGSGRIFLFASGIFATVILGIKAGIFVFILQAIVLFLFSYLLKVDFQTWANIELYSQSSWITSSSTFIFLSIIFVIAIGRMINGLSFTFSELQRANSDIKKSEERFRTIVENANDVIFYVDKENKKIGYVSPICKFVLGYEQSDFEGMDYASFIHKDDVARAEELLEKILAGTAAQEEIEYRILHKNGTWNWHLTRGGPLKDADGNITGFVGIARDVTERRQIEQDLINARDEAEAANKAKSEFLANMSHEVRTPLNGVMGMLQFLQVTELDSQQQEYAETAIQSCRRLNRLLTDILDFSRIEAGMLFIQSAPLDLTEVLCQTRDLFASVTRESGVAFHVDVDPSIPKRLLGDGARLQQVLTNMVGNALKFTHAGSVMLEVSRLPVLLDDECRVLFSVTDTGIGIPDDKLASLFKPFSQVNEGYTRSYQGAGLGLSICRRLVGLMGGGISVVSEPGVGTTMCFSLSFRLGKSDEKSRPAHAPHFVPHLEGLNLLLAEDDPYSGIMVAKLLRKFGATAKHVANGRQAVEALRQEDFDLVLMDVQMPVMDGIEATLAIRGAEAGERMRNVPIVALTAYTLASDKEKFARAGMNGYVPKPVEIEELLRAIEESLRQRRA